LIRWCVTGRAVSTLGKIWKIRASPSLTHPTPFLFFFTNMRCTPLNNSSKNKVGAVEPNLLHL
ncbi:hypothetical protein, partial [Moorena sp. SIO4G3]|uniref:hypothetical protein n=1 Tax=Moorena sp. SIO4G3 TaxID=2607821 RepID=UPI0025E9D938